MALDATTDMTAGDGALRSKFLAMLFLGASSLIAGSVPVCVFDRLVGRGRPRVSGALVDSVLRVVLNFGGGVLLCTTFLHLLPEVREGVEQLARQNILDAGQHSTEMLAELIMCVGFFFIYSVEELVHAFADGHHHGHSLHGSFASAGIANPAYERNGESRASPASTAGKMSNYNSFAPATGPPPPRKPRTPALQTGGASFFRGLLIVGALSIHELFEGLAVGLEKNATQVWSLAVAVACHKIVIAFYVGLQIISDNTKAWLAHGMVFVFAVASPLGIGAGALISNLDSTNEMVVMSVLLQGLATGTLTYVVFFEVLKPSPGHLGVGHRLLKLFSVAVGFVTMLAVMLTMSAE
ncbi:zinc transporter ZIP1-like [Adelges cooleyi]|uniref:zinc transporter ZIP1-like n=1 Tax=Adelges cooleyi TaxID=133065 RepID=UPI00217FC6EE|nr:zinc transporter ZIP1-like [Adelges cooleyi]